MTIAAQIQEILDIRQQQLPGLDIDVQAAGVLPDVVRDLASSHERIASLLPAETVERTVSLSRNCTAALAQLKSLRERFSRPYLTLVEPGRAKAASCSL